MDQKQFKEKLKQALKDFDPLRKASWSKLTDLGFTVMRGTKHSKLYYHGKVEEYMFPVSCTTSDKRMVLNLTSVIMNKIKGDLR